MKKKIQIQRTFIPGSEWIYLKIYTGTKTADKILINDVYYIVNKLKQNDLIKKWFFIRYSDPEFHLRIRFLAKEQINVAEILSQCCERLYPYVRENLIWKIQIDTYSRELERYGYILIEDAELIFQIDSECIIYLLKKLNNEEFRWMIGLKLIDSFLDDFSLNVHQKQNLLKSLMIAFKKEFGFDSYNSKQLNSKYRENRKIIESVLDEKIEEKSFISLFPVVRKRSKELKPIVNVIKQKITLYGITDLENSFIGSYIHMTLNRLFKSKNRQYELLLYDFMYRYYNSKIAKNNFIMNIE